MRTEYDVAIVGGGLVGASLGCALSGHGMRIALLERVPPRAPTQPSYDDRTLALALASQRIFEGIGLWPGLADGVTAIREVHVSNRGRFGAVRIRATDFDLPALGYVAEARVIGAAVAGVLPRLDDVELQAPCEVMSLEPREDAVLVGTRTEAGRRSLSARLVVGADGTASTVRALLGLACEEHDYRQTAVIANVTPAQAHRGRAFERLTESGPVALLPHVGARCGVVWVSARADAKKLLQLDDAAFLGALQRRFGYRLGRFTRLGRRASYPLTRLYVPEPRASRCLLIGNAAHTIHPIAAQGFNLGLRDVAVLAELLVEAHGSGADLGSADLLSAYQTWREPDQRRMLAFTDGLVRLFAQEFLPLRVLRGAGLVALDALPGLRRALARRTMGFGGRVPLLARGVARGATGER